MTRQSGNYPLDYSKGPAGPEENRLREMADKATDKLETVDEDAQELAGKVAQQAREYGDMAQEAAKNVKPFVERSLREQPLATLAVASVIGFALGALWKK